MSRPRVLFVSRGRITVPLEPWLARRYDALSEQLDLRALHAGTGSGDPRIELLPERSWQYYPGLPLAIARTLRRFDADVVVASDPYVGAAALAGRRIARSRAKVVVELHGDPGTFTRLYGSSARRLVAGLADRVARSAIRGADATRAVSRFTARLVEAARGVPPTATFLAYSDLSAFVERPPAPVPESPAIVFVGSLERYKNIDGLAAAWRRVVVRVPEARLTIVGRGSRRPVVDALVRELPESVVHREWLDPPEVARVLDESRALVLPSYPEGLGRVVIEAFARGRGVIGTDGGGIVDLVVDDRNGLLVPPYDVDELVEALARVLEDHQLAVRLGAAAQETYGAWHQTPEDFARAYRELVDRVLAGAR